MAIALLDAMGELCRSLSPAWVELLRQQGLDLGRRVLNHRERLRAELARELEVDRRVPGFEDFALDRAPAVSPGRPAFGVLYHALASPHVHPDPSGADPEVGYPTLHDLDLVENYAYSLVSDRVDATRGFVAVFAYQYRPASRSAHRRHADLAFAATGVARVGTAPPRYEGFRRSFWVEPSDGRGIAVMPARYGAFLSRRSRAGDVGCVALGPEDTPDTEYVFPVHKLFDGRECIAGLDLRVELSEYHLNDRLRRPTNASDVPFGTRPYTFPFARDSENGGDLVRLQPVGASALVVPIHRNTLVRNIGSHVVDDTCDGVVAARVRGLPPAPQSRPALSLVTAPSFFPLVAPEALCERGIDDVRPLSRVRLGANPALPVPGRRRVRAFDPSDVTLTALVGGHPTHGPERPSRGRDVLTSSLPDAACYTRASGGDASRRRDERGAFLTAITGSEPFVEGLRRAATGLGEGALVPDSARAFAGRSRLPLLDSELGIHPDHARRAQRCTGAPPERGWDGGFGPFFETVAGVDFVNGARLRQTDYTARARESLLRVSLTARLRTEDLLTRWTALRVSESVLEREGVRHDCLVVAESIEDWGKHPDRADPLISGGGFRFVFAELGGATDAADPSRLRRRLVRTCELQLSREAVAARRGGAFQIYRIA